MENTKNTENVQSTELARKVPTHLRPKNVINTFLQSTNIVFDVTQIKSLFDAETLINMSESIDSRMNLAKYKAVEKVYSAKLWENATYFTQDGSPRKYISFEDWCKKAYNIGKTSVYDYLKAAKFITPNGAETTFPHTSKDFTFTQIITILNAKELCVEEIEKVGKKEVKRKKPNEKLIFELCERGVLNPYDTISEMKRKIKKHFAPEALTETPETETPETETPETETPETETPETETPETETPETERPNVQDIASWIDEHLTIEEIVELITILSEKE